MSGFWGPGDKQRLPLPQCLQEQHFVSFCFTFLIHSSSGLNDGNPFTSGGAPSGGG